MSNIMKFFEYEGMPEEIRKVTKDICCAAWEMEEMLPDSEEKAAGLRKLLEAKDCFVRAAVLGGQ